MMSTFKTLVLFCQIVSELDVENLQEPETLDQDQASTFKEPDAKRTKIELWYFMMLTKLSLTIV